MLAPWQESYDKPRQCIKKQRNHFANKGLSNQSYVFTSVMYGCESWTIKKAECQRIHAFELWCWRGLLRVPWTARRSTLSSQWKDWCWIWSSNTLACLEDMTHKKRPWCWERLKAGGEGATEDEVVGWHHWLKGHEFEQAPGDGEGQGSQACCSPWGHKESDTTEWLNWTELKFPEISKMPGARYVLLCFL